MDETALKQLEQLAKYMKDKGYPHKIHNADGTLDYKKLIRTVKSPEFSKFREAHPDFAANAKTNTALDFITKGASLGMGVAKLAHSLGQIRRGKNIDSTPPAYAKRVGRNRNLRRGLADAYRNASQGMTDAERQLLNEGQERDYLRDRNNIVSTSGGQSSTARANLQALAARRSAQRLRNTVASEGIRRNNRSRFDKLTGMEMQEDQRMERFGQQRFRDRSMPLYRMNMAAKDRLINTGLTNAWNSADNILGNAVGLGNMFRNDLPGTVYDNKRYGNDHPLGAVFNNPTNTMQTGDALLGGAINGMQGGASGLGQGYKQGLDDMHEYDFYNQNQGR